MVFDELSVSFENPAKDALGHQHVVGKLVCANDSLSLQFKERDRAFRKGEAKSVEFAYDEVERVEYVSKWFRPKLLILYTRSPEKLSIFPGADVGRVELQLEKSSYTHAKRVGSLVDLRQSEAMLLKSEERRSRRFEAE